MSRPISRKLLDGATAPGEGPRILDTESFQKTWLQPVYTAKRFSIAIKGLPLNSTEPTTVAKLDHLSCKSSDTVEVLSWPPIEETWAEVLTIDGGEVTLYLLGRD